MNAEIDLLGGLPSGVDGRPIAATEWRRRQAASLVKLLALAPRRTLHREQVIDALWPGAVIDDAGPRLHNAAHFARRLLGDSRAPHFVTMGTTQMNSRLNAGHDPNHLAEPPRFNTEPVTHGRAGPCQNRCSGGGPRFGTTETLCVSLTASVHPPTPQRRHKHASTGSRH